MIIDSPRDYRQCRTTCYKRPGEGTGTGHNRVERRLGARLSRELPVTLCDRDRVTRPAVNCCYGQRPRCWGRWPPGFGVTHRSWSSGRSSRQMSAFPGVIAKRLPGPSACDRSPNICQRRSPPRRFEGHARISSSVLQGRAGGHCCVHEMRQEDQACALPARKRGRQDPSGRPPTRQSFCRSPTGVPVREFRRCGASRTQV